MRLTLLAPRNLASVGLNVVIKDHMSYHAVILMFKCYTLGYVSLR